MKKIVKLIGNLTSKRGNNGVVAVYECNHGKEGNKKYDL